ncbi:Cyclopropane-fatty-acyl-phospholipid synthase [Gossypium australe]|uniref:Cyclopropane-fatty-acyl-phospholipid synthase n=1 Tax=Gossypium australe TaxID=47621 RepID=A0A5B6VIE9_9ROSI|nr:Cyclopropane-fatty-acyl-phospholipid synthase [Gossypium australe]
MAWDKMCYPKGMRGLGFRDLHLFNIAFLGRQVWRLIICKDTLCYKVLSAKYFPNGYVFHPKKSIAKAASILSEGFGWSVEDGRSIDLWKDNWGFEGLSGSAIRLKRRLTHETKVSKLIRDNRDGGKKIGFWSFSGKT